MTHNNSQNCNANQIRLKMDREAGFETNSNLGSLSNSLHLRSYNIKKDLIELSQTQKLPLDFNVEVNENEVQGSQAFEPSVSEQLITRLNSKALLS